MEATKQPRTKARRLRLVACMGRCTRCSGCAIARGAQNHSPRGARRPGIATGGAVGIETPSRTASARKQRS